MSTRWSIAALAAAGLIGAGAAAAALRQSLPQTQGELQLAGLDAPVTVVRDRWGVPHIYAGSEHDLFFAQGFVHAQDRLWQMELNRRLAHGELAELFGPAALDSDRFVRVLGFTRVAHAEVGMLSPAARAAIEAYCAGVNAWLQSGATLPVELRLLRHQPRLWAPVDVLVWGKVMALNLSDSWFMESFREWQRRLAMMTPDQPVPALALPAVPGSASGVGSNAWAVNGSRTTSGSPLLANDVHLQITLPSLWYEVHLDSGDVQLAGMGIPGLPAILAGHSRWIAWGFTNSMIDADDLVVERRHPTDPRRFAVGDAWEPARVVVETIRVKDQEPHRETVLLTRHGPVVSPVLPGEARCVSLRWTALAPGRTVEAVLAMCQARDVAAFRAALESWAAPAQNVVFAHVDGDIGHVLAGALPLRTGGDDSSMPVDGRAERNEWHGMIPPHQNPATLNPPDGMIVSANDGGLVPAGYPYPLPANYWNPYRSQRIRALVEASEQHDALSFSRIQQDVFSLPGQHLAGLAEFLPGDDPVALQARNILAAWDSQLTAESAAGAIYSELRYQIGHLLMRDDEEATRVRIGIGLWMRAPIDGVLARQFPQTLEWLGRAMRDGGPDASRARAVLREAWSASMRALRASQGDDPRTWRYGATHQVLLRHAMGDLPVIGMLFNRGPFPTGGDFDTVNCGHLPRDYGAIQPYVGPAYRLIFDLADWDAALSIHATGQSGHPASRHYVDQTADWLAGRYHPLLWTRPRVEAHAVARLTLRPR